MSHAALLESAAALSSLMDMSKGNLAICSESRRVRLSDMVHVFADEDARASAQESGDSVVYEMYLNDPVDQPRETALQYSTTVVHRGVVGSEYYMTRGHAHTGPALPEICLTVSGEGMMVLQTDDHQVQGLAMAPGTVLYTPAATAHRAVNVGDESLVTFSVRQVASGVDYRPVEMSGFRRIVTATPNGPDLAPNPGFKLGQ